LKLHIDGDKRAALGQVIIDANAAARRRWIPAANLHQSQFIHQRRRGAAFPELRAIGIRGNLPHCGESVVATLRAG
jgi:hypothetical protein